MQYDASKAVEPVPPWFRIEIQAWPGGPSGLYETNPPVSVAIDRKLTERDLWDAEQNMLRLAEQLVVEAFARLRHRLGAGKSG